jgi:hypothetical protein
MMHLPTDVVEPSIGSNNALIELESVRIRIGL